MIIQTLLQGPGDQGSLDIGMIIGLIVLVVFIIFIAILVYKVLKARKGAIKAEKDDSEPRL